MCGCVLTVREYACVCERARLQAVCMEMRMRVHACACSFLYLRHIWELALKVARRTQNSHHRTHAIIVVVL